MAIITTDFFSMRVDISHDVPDQERKFWEIVNGVIADDDVTPEDLFENLNQGC